MLVHEAIADPLIERLAGAVDVLEVGQADELGDRRPAGDRARRAQERVDRYAELAGGERADRRPRRSDVPAAGLVLPAHGRRRPPARLAPCCERRSSGRCSRSSACATSSRLRHRRRAPVRAHRRAVRAQPGRVEAVVRRSPVGNLYVNRGITGAMVGRQPFGGNRLSGTGTKAGGPDYLLHFVEPRVVTENTMRHGLVV